jgi:hypothetical protein
VKSISQKYGSNGALGNFDGSPNPRTHSAVYVLPFVTAHSVWTDQCSTLIT